MAEDFDVSGLDETIHGRIRLGIMAYLAGAETADFVTLKEKLRTTDGNLSRHLGKLEEAGFVAIRKSFRARRPHTEVIMTECGRSAFVDYLDRLAALLPERGE